MTQIAARNGRLVTALRRPPLSVEIARHLLDYLLSENIAAGSKIPSERQLAEDLGVGRTAIREALKSLALLGLLEIRQGDGTYLAASTSQLLPSIIEWGVLLGQQDLGQLIEARAVLEATLVEMAAQRRTTEQAKELSTIIGRMTAAADDFDEYVAADIEFHLKIGESSGNAVLAGTLNSIRSLLEVWTRRVILSQGRTDQSLALHVPIFDAINDQDPTAARAAMEHHMDLASANLLQTITQTHDST